ncbi:MAG: lytic transglycosylase domain-containing protein [Desulfobacterales bacterium]
MKSIIIPILMGLFSLNFFIRQSDSGLERIGALEQDFNTLRSIMQIDQERQSTEQKIIQIIERYNPYMPLSMKRKIAKEIYRMSLKYPNLDVNLICATITHESGRAWNPRVVSNAGAMGLMQIMPNTGKWLAKYEGIKWTTAEEILFNPIYNIRLGTRYLSALVETYDVEGGLAAYNGGAKRVELWLAKNKADGILWAETQDYIPFVLKLYAEYKKFAL